MPEDEPHTGEEQEAEAAEQEDVGAKLAKLSGSRIRQQRAERRKEASARSNKASSREPAPTPQPEWLPPAAPEEPADAPPVPAATDDAPDVPPKPARQKEPTRKLAPSTTGNVSAPIALAAGLAAGLVPAVVYFVIGLFSSAAPEGVPADAVQRRYDWVHCTESIATNRWRCDVYDSNGVAAGVGEFVAMVDGTFAGDDWRQLATSRSLVHHGWYDAKLARSRTLYVRGVKVGSVRTTRSE